MKYREQTIASMRNDGYNETRPVACVHRAFEDQFGGIHSRCAYLINDYGGHAINIEEMEA